MAIGKQVFDFIEKVEAFKQSLMTFKTLWIILVIFLPFFIYINYRISKNIYQRFLNYKERKRQIENTKNEIEELLKMSLNYLNKEELREVLGNVNDALSECKEYRKLKIFYKGLIQKKNSIKVALLGVEKKEILNNFEDTKNKLKEEIEELKEEEEDRKLELENKNWSILCRMDADRTEAFLRRELTYEQIEALHAYDWEDANEYDVMEKKTIPVLVKKIMNHSKTHTFLVWSVKRLLESLGIRAEKHDTKYPDITFFHNDEWWAIEIEKGSLLRKKSQMRKKVDFLNRNYPSRWMFVVSNKDLLPQYREWGFTTPRSGVEKTIKNWLNPSI